MPRAEIKILFPRCKVMPVAGAPDIFQVRVGGTSTFGGRSLVGGDKLGGVTLPHECVMVEIESDPIVQGPVPVDPDDGTFQLIEDVHIDQGLSVVKVRAFLVGFPDILTEQTLAIPGRTMVVPAVIHRDSWKIVLENAMVAHLPTGQCEVTVVGHTSDGHGGFVVGGAPDGLGGHLAVEPVAIYHNGIITGNQCVVSGADGRFMGSFVFTPGGQTSVSVEVQIIGSSVRDAKTVPIPEKPVVAQPVVHRDSWKATIGSADVEHTAAGEIRVTVRGHTSDGHGGFVLGGKPDGLGGVLPADLVKFYRDGIDTGKAAAVANADGRFTGSFTFVPALGQTMVKVGVQIIGSSVKDEVPFQIPEKPAVAPTPGAERPEHLDIIHHWSDDGKRVNVNLSLRDKDGQPCGGTVRVICDELKGNANGFEDVVIPATGTAFKTAWLKRPDDIRFTVLENTALETELKNPALGLRR